MPATETIVEVLGGSKVFRKRIAGPWELQERARKGLPYAAYEALVATLQLRGEETVSVLHLTPRTLARRKEEHVLHADESDRVLRVARIMAQAHEVLGSEGKARSWLRRNNRALRNETPISLLDTDIGTQQVEDVLLRLERGVIS